MYAPTSFISSSNSRSPGIITNLNIVSDFYVDDKHFLIVSLDQLTINEQEELFLEISIVGRLLSEGKNYAIVHDSENQQELEKKQESDEQQELEKKRLKLTSILTDRELQIVTLVALGWSNKQIASHLEISQWTVSAHLRRIFIKVDVNSRAAMIYQCSVMINHLH